MALLIYLIYFFFLIGMVINKFAPKKATKRKMAIECRLTLLTKRSYLDLTSHGV